MFQGCDGGVSNLPVDICLVAEQAPVKNKSERISFFYRYFQEIVSSSKNQFRLQFHLESFQRGRIGLCVCLFVSVAAGFVLITVAYC